MKELELYEGLILDEDEEGVFAMSLVSKGATKKNWVAFEHEYRKEVIMNDEEKQIVTSVALIPEQIIYRKINGKEFNIKFSAETIEKTAELFMKRMSQKNATVEHAADVDGVTFIESWIINDPKNDKACALGFDLPKGSWMLSAKIDNDNLWEEYIKTNKLNAFSVEGFYDFRRVEMSDQEVLDKITNILNNKEYNDETLSEVKELLNNGDSAK